jgi:molecular chaperone DnaK
VHAHILETKAKAAKTNLGIEEIVEISVNAHSLGVEARSGDERVNSKLVLKNTQLPAAADRVFYTSHPNQAKVRVRILQGEANQSAACIPVGECWIEDLPLDLPKGSPIRVRCGVAANGLIEVTAVDLASGSTAKAVIHRTGGLEPDDLAEEAKYVKSLKIS